MPAADQPVRILLLEDSDIDAELISRQLDKVAGLVLERGSFAASSSGCSKSGVST